MLWNKIYAPIITELKCFKIMQNNVSLESHQVVCLRQWVNKASWLIFRLLKSAYFQWVLTEFKILKFDLLISQWKLFLKNNFFSVLVKYTHNDYRALIYSIKMTIMEFNAKMVQWPQTLNGSSSRHEANLILETNWSISRREQEGWRSGMSSWVNVIMPLVAPGRSLCFPSSLFLSSVFL